MRRPRVWVYLVLGISWMSCGVLKAQDEKFLRKILTKPHLEKVQSAQGNQNAKWEVGSGLHHYDLNEDGLLEKISVSKRDGLDYVTLYDANNRKIFENQLQVKGTKSGVYRMDIVHVSPATKVLILHYFEGVAKYVELMATSRLYFITIDRNNLATLKWQTGPQVWEEHRSLQGHYHRRLYKLSTSDLNQDGVKEIVVKQGKLAKVFMYLGEGRWKFL